MSSLGAAQADLIGQDRSGAASNLVVTAGLVEDLDSISQTPEMTNALGKSVSAIQKAVAKFAVAVVRAENVVDDSAASSNAAMAAVSSAETCGNNIIKALLRTPAAGSLVILEPLSSAPNGGFSPGQRVSYRIHAPNLQGVQVSVSNNQSSVVVPTVQWSSPAIFYVTTGPNAGSAQISAGLAGQSSSLPLTNNGHFKKGSVPSAPGALVAVAASSSEIDLTWTNTSSNITGFNLVQALSTNGPWTQIALVGAMQTAYANTGLVASTTYFYQVQAYGSSGSSAYSAMADASTPAASGAAPPSVPAGLMAAAASSSQINLTWNQSSDNGGPGLAGYEIDRNGVQIALTSSTNYSDTGLSSGTQYCYTVAAYDNAGNTSSASVQACAMTPVNPPAAPSNLQATAVSTNQIDLAWTSNSTNQTGYVVQRAQSSGGPWVQIATVGAGVTGYNDTSVSASTAYYYQVQAVNAGGGSGFSNVASAQTPAPPNAVVPSTPSGLTATAAATNQINLTWSASTDTGGPGLADYVIYQGGVEVGTTATTGYTAGGLSAGTQYCYTVAALDVSGNLSGQSAQACATTETPPDTTPPSVPTNLTATAVSTNQIDLSWSASTDTGGSGLAGYHVYQAGVLIATTALRARGVSGLLAGTQYCFTVAAYDNAGNVSAQSAPACATTQTPPDTTPPTVSMTAPAAGGIMRGTIALGASASDNVGVTQVAFYRDNGVLLATTASSPYTASFDSTTVADGSHTFYALASDAAGNAGTAAVVTVTTDNSAPTVSLTAPVNGGVVSNTIALSATAGDDSGIWKVLFYRDGGTLVGTSTSAPYSMAFDTTTLAAGSHSFYAVAYNVVTNTATSAASTVTVQNAPVTNSVNTGLVGYLPEVGTARDVVTTGTIAYVASDVWGLALADVTSPGAPRAIGASDVPFNGTYVAVSGTLACVTGNRTYITTGNVSTNVNGFYLLNVSVPTNTAMLGMLEGITTTYNGVAISGSYAYVACGSSGLEVFNISNPASPVLVGSYQGSAYAWTVAIAGNYAYVADGVGGVLILNIGNPSSPALAGTFSTTARDVAVQGNYAYVACGNAMQVVNVSNPSSPVLAGSLAESYPVSIVKVRVQNSTVYAAGSGGGLLVIDVSAPSSPALLGSLLPSGVNSASTMGLSVVGTTVYLANYVAGLGVVDVSTPSSPTQTGDLMEWFDGTKMASSGGTTVVTGIREWQGGLQTINALRVLNTQDPSAPVLMGSIETNGLTFSAAAIGGNYVYAACGTAGLRVIDVSNPAAPVIVGAYKPSGYAWGIALAGQYVYLATGSQGLSILDVSNPTSPANVGFVSLPGTAKDVAVSNGVAYVADGNSLQIVNVSAPSSPTVLGSLSLGYPISAVSVKVQNNVAYLGGSAGGLVTVNVSNPASPQILGSLAAAGGSSASTVGLFLSGTKAYLGNSVGGFAIVDVSNPSSPVLDDIIMTVGNGGDVYVNSGWAYTADSLATLDTIYLGQ